MNNRINRSKNGSFLFTVLFFGGLWGLVEATLGYVLHLMPLQTISGTILFPAGLYFMIRGMKVSGRISAVPAIAMVAAAVKLFSVALPFVAFRFVRNPALAILTEGVLAALVLGTGELKADWKLPAKAAILSFGWRSVFLGVNILFGLSGIASKPAVLQRRFVFMDGGIDAVIIIAAILLSGAAASRKTDPAPRLRPVGLFPALSALAAGIGVQIITAGL